MAVDEKRVVEVLESNIDKKSFRLVAMATYSLENLDHSQKTLFGYALKGRTKNKGFIQSLDGEAVGRNNVLLPLQNLPQLKEFFATWKVDYEVRKFVELG